MIATINSILGPRTLGPVLAVALCYPLRNLTHPAWKLDPNRRLALATYSALLAYAAVIAVVNFPQFIRWHHIPETLYPALGGEWGIEHVVGFFAAWFVFRRTSPAPDFYQDATIFLRGRRLVHFAEAFAKATRRLGVSSRHLFWGMLPLRVEERLKNFLVVGAPGSGKTVAIQLLLKSIVQWMKKGSRTRMVLYDAKTDWWQILSAMRPQCPIMTMNLADRRVRPWHMARDIKTRKDAAETVAILVPEDPAREEAPFFLKTTRLLIQGCMESLMLSKPGEWTLRDLVLALKSPKRVEGVLSRHPQTRHLLANLAEPKTRNNVLSTIQIEREKFTNMAAVWHKVWPDESRRLSLSEWIHSDSILLLGQATAEGSPNRALNQLVLQRLAELLDREPNSYKERTWLILDELTDLQYVRGLDLLLRRGRSKGVSSVLGFQTWPGMLRAFKPDLAAEITALCAYKSFLGVNDPPTAQWAAAHFGQQELLEYRVNHSESTNDNGKTTNGRSRNVQQVTRPSVMAEEFLTIPPTNAENGFTGYHISPLIKDGYKTEVPWSWIMEQLRSPAQQAFEGATFSEGSTIAAKLASEPAFKGWGAEEASFEYLPDWSDEECKALGLPPVSELDTQAAPQNKKETAEKIKNLNRADLN
jgi:hypothetical protein